MSKILFSLREDITHIFKPSFYYIDSIQKRSMMSAVSDIFTSEDMVSIFFIEKQLILL